MFAYVYALSK